MTDFTQADIAAMRKRGNLRSFLRQQPQPAAPDTEPDRAPGAWPAGTRPPRPPTPTPGADWQGALDAYRAWAAEADRTEDNTRYRCECGACPDEEDS